MVSYMMHTSVISSFLERLAYQKSSGHVLEKTDCTVMKIQSGKEDFKIIKVFLPEKLVLFT